jgi:hypothetical protein
VQAVDARVHALIDDKGMTRYYPVFVKSDGTQLPVSAEYLRAAMEDTKELLTKQLQNERETSQTIIQALNMEAESLRAQLICQEAPGRKDFVNTCDVGVGGE